MFILVQKGVVTGDGYDKRNKANPLGSKFVSPYSKYESFAGLNITRALKVCIGLLLIQKNSQHL